MESTTQFGDMFDAPSEPVPNAEATMPKKGGRPGQEDAERAHMAMYGGTKLTKGMIEQWALNQGKFVWPKDAGPTLGLTRAEFDALVLGLPWQRMGSQGAITVI